MNIYMYATPGQIVVEAVSQEEADKKLNAMTPDEVLAELGGVECFDVIEDDDILDPQKEADEEERLRQLLFSGKARLKPDRESRPGVTP